MPLADGHALSIGMTTIGDDACFGVYADAEALPDGDAFGERLDARVDDLLAEARA